MANFPSILNTFSRPTTTDKLNSPSHSSLHNTVSSALGQIEAMIGVVGVNSVVGTLSYDVRSPGSDGGGHVQTAIRGGTGQTTFIKGDILVAQSASVLSKLAVSPVNDYALTTDSSTSSGVKWAGIGARVSSFLSDGTYIKPSNAKLISVVLIGGGGGGGGGRWEGTSNGSGGGGGAMTTQYYLADIFPSSIAVFVGLGGTGGSVTGVGQTGNGTNGGKSYISNPSIMVAYGGSLGQGSGNSSGGGGSITGTGFAGENGIAGGGGAEGYGGAAGGNSNGYCLYSGAGGQGMNGGYTPGSIGGTYGGGGGGGGFGNTDLPTGTGGAGSKGIVIFNTFI